MRWTPKKDPYLKEDAEQYEQTIPSRQYLLEFLESRQGPATHQETCKELGIKEVAAIEGVRRRLVAMCRDGQLITNRREAFGVLNRMDLKAGRVQGHRDGYGFFIPDEGGGDWYLSARQMQKVFDGDRVIARKSDDGHSQRDEAIIVEVIERAHTRLVGRYFEESGVGFVVPENQRITQDIRVSQDGELSPSMGQYVMIELVVPPAPRASAVGRVVEIIGDHMAPGMEIDVALRSYDIPFTWPAAVDAAIKKMPDQVNARDIKTRFDLRDLPFVTIDGEDARDFDDAVYCEPSSKGGWTLYVAIADVSHYVKVGSALDTEAEQRGTSVYFPEQVIPMLPEALSNGLCSLNPNVDRLVMVCQMELDASGQVNTYQFMEGVIHSHARLTYTKVGHMLMQPDSELGQSLRERYQSLVPNLEDLYALFKVLLKARKQRGAIEFESTETRIIFGPDRKIEDITPVARNDAHRLIEECMLCANVCAADFLERHKLPALYRIHEPPKEQKLTNLREFLAELALNLKGGDKPTGQDYQSLMEQIQGRPDQHVIQTVMLRSMQQAVYDPDNQGHFGLGYEAYAHFTSPIRRYPDLLVHRAIRSVIRSKRKTRFVQRLPSNPVMAKKAIYPYNLERMVQLGEQCSMTERRADEAVRDVMDWLKCEYMQERVGESYAGIVTGVTAFGLFIELKDVYVEGLLHVSALKNDYYHFEPVKHRLVGERTHQSYRLGDEVQVQVMRVGLDERRIDFELAEDNQPDTSHKPSVREQLRTRAGLEEVRGRTKPRHRKQAAYAEAGIETESFGDRRTGNKAGKKTSKTRSKKQAGQTKNTKTKRASSKPAKRTAVKTGAAKPNAKRTVKKSAAKKGANKKATVKKTGVKKTGVKKTVRKKTTANQSRPVRKRPAKKSGPRASKK